MARTPKTVEIRLHELMLLMTYRLAATNAAQIGELGDKNQDDLLWEIDRQSSVQIRPSQLADLIHHMKEVVFEQIPSMKLDLTIKNHNKVMRRLKAQMPELFKETAAGEVVMINYESRKDV